MLDNSYFQRLQNPDKPATSITSLVALQLSYTVHSFPAVPDMHRRGLFFLFLSDVAHDNGHKHKTF